MTELNPQVVLAIVQEIDPITYERAMLRAANQALSAEVQRLTAESQEGVVD